MTERELTKPQLGQWRKLRRMQVATGGQRGIKSYFSHAPRTRAARRATTTDSGSAAAATAATSPAATAARQAATAATASQLRRQNPECATEQKGKRHRQHDDDDLDTANRSYGADNEHLPSEEHRTSAECATIVGAMSLLKKCLLNPPSCLSLSKLKVRNSWKK